MKDCIIVGGGPAGLTAALYLARFLRSVSVVDAEEGRARMIPMTHNLAPFPEGIGGPDLLDRMRAHARRYGAAIESGRVTEIIARGDGFRVTTATGIEVARTVILATGVVNHRPPLSDAEHDRGVRHGLIRYCPVCDGYEVRGRRVAVLGSGAHGRAEASFVHRYAPDVTLVPADGTVAEALDGIAGLAAPMSALTLSDDGVVVTLADAGTHIFDTLYVALGTAPRTDLVPLPGVALDDEGCIKTDAELETGVTGLYAIGDVTNGLDQIAHAMGQGAVAATAIHNALTRRERD